MNASKDNIRDAVEEALIAVNEEYPPIESPIDARVAICGAFIEAKKELNKCKKITDEFFAHIKSDDVEDTLIATVRMKYLGMQLAAAASMMAAVSIKAEQSLAESLEKSE